MNEAYAFNIPAEESVNPDNLSFKEYIQYKMKGVEGKGGRKCITAAELAEALGMSTKVFLEILNGRRTGPDRRDFVIALCAELGLDAGETDEALSLFPTMLRPLSESDRRDRSERSCRDRDLLVVCHHEPDPRRCCRRRTQQIAFPAVGCGIGQLERASR